MNTLTPTDVVALIVTVSCIVITVILSITRKDSAIVTALSSALKTALKAQANLPPIYHTVLEQRVELIERQLLFAFNQNKDAQIIADPVSAPALPSNPIVKS